MVGRLPVLSFWNVVYCLGCYWNKLGCGQNCQKRHLVVEMGNAPSNVPQIRRSVVLYMPQNIVSKWVFKRNISWFFYLPTLGTIRVLPFGLYYTSTWVRERLTDESISSDPTGNRKDRAFNFHLVFKGLKTGSLLRTITYPTYGRGKSSGPSYLEMGYVSSLEGREVTYHAMTFEGFLSAWQAAASMLSLRRAWIRDLEMVRDGCYGREIFSVRDPLGKSFLKISRSIRHHRIHGNGVFTC